MGRVSASREEVLHPGEGDLHPEGGLHPGEERVCIGGDWQTPPIHEILRDTVNKQAVRILLECIKYKMCIFPGFPLFRTDKIP